MGCTVYALGFAFGFGIIFWLDPIVSEWLLDRTPPWWERWGYRFSSVYFVRDIPPICGRKESRTTLFAGRRYNRLRITWQNGKAARRTRNRDAGGSVADLYQPVERQW